MISSVVVPAALLMSQVLSQSTSATVTVNLYGNKECTGTITKTFDTPADKCIVGSELAKALQLNDPAAEAIISEFSAKASCSSKLVPSFVVYDSKDCTGDVLTDDIISQSSSGCTTFPGIQTGMVVNGTALVCKVDTTTTTTLVGTTTGTASGTATATASSNGTATGTKTGTATGTATATASSNGTATGTKTGTATSKPTNVPVNAGNAINGVISLALGAMAMLLL